ncbi:hypothetical protein QTH90_04750 [Variovorax sp. J2P1-59]|uniref:hypothetical protein n=1 Tax=Variovorax flavidus TaxID=3053501 RepID=UPI002575162E|nr:hypothetical protein [Variovorax sp. J2P1-59]MDM0073675.1 hypothetical protein [Variovorax sp. J2P1-59]
MGAKSVSGQPVGNDVMHSMQNLAIERFRAWQLGQINAMGNTAQSWERPKEDRW